MDLYLTEAQTVQLQVFTQRGLKIYEHAISNLSPGSHRITWDGSHQSGSAAASGAYLLRIKTKRLVQTKKIIIVR
jgi:flagellar hook assembly protein FlgD